MEKIQVDIFGVIDKSLKRRGVHVDPEGDERQSAAADYYRRV